MSTVSLLLLWYNIHMDIFKESSSQPEPPKPLSSVPSKAPSAPPVPKVPSKMSNLTEPQLRTMREDIEILKKGGRPTKTIVPPKNLPIVGNEPVVSKEAEKEATRQAFGEVMKEVKEIRREKEESKELTKPEEKEKEPVIYPSVKKPTLFPPDKDSKPPIIPPKPPVIPPEPIKPSVKPPIPIKPDIKPVIEKSEVPTPPVKKSKKGLFIVLAIVVALLAAGGGFVYWWNFMRQPATHLECQNFQCVSVEGEGENLCQTDDDCLPPEPEMPVSLISVSGTEVVEFVDGQELAEFLNNLNAVINKQTEQDSLRRILIKKVSTDKREYASLTDLSDMISNIRFSIPLALKSSFGENYTLFVYTPGTEEYDICQSAGLSGSSCFGPRLGLVIELSDKTEATSELVKWEETILDDLKPLILAETTGEAEFQSSTIEDLKGASFVRYANLPISSISIDYGIKDNLLIIGTSKNSFFKALNSTQ